MKDVHDVKVFADGHDLWDGVIVRAKCGALLPSDSPPCGFTGQFEPIDVQLGKPSTKAKHQSMTYCFASRRRVSHVLLDSIGSALVLYFGAKVPGGAS